MMAGVVGWARMVSVVLLAVVVVGCGNLQGLQVASLPQDVAGRAYVVSPQPPRKEAVAPRGHVLEKDGLYVLQTGGGSAAVGLLLGPLGILANQANIEARSREMGETAKQSSLLKLVPAEEALTAWQGLPDAPPAASGADAGALTVAPYLMLYADDDRKNLYTVAGLRVQAPEKAGAPAWNGNYHYALERMLPIERLASASPGPEFEAYRAEIQEGYRQLRAELRADLDPQASKNAHATVASIRAPVLKSTLMGFAGFTSGDVDRASNGRLVMRVNMANYGPAMDKSVPYFLWIFPSEKQYAFDLGPEPRKPGQ